MARENIVLAATSFLSSPTVQKYSDEMKRKFLIEKGLKSEEVTDAFAKVCNAKHADEQKKEFCIMMDQRLQEDGYIKNKMVPTRPSVPIVIFAAMSSAAIGIVVYIFRLLKQHCWPWIIHHWNSIQGKRNEIPCLDSQITDQNISQIYELQNQINSIKSDLDQQQMQIMQLSSNNSTTLEELKKDLVSIKKMVLSKDSFPLPEISTVPSWQIKRQGGDRKSPETNCMSQNISIIKTVESFEEITSPNNTSNADNAQEPDDVASDSSESSSDRIEDTKQASNNENNSKPSNSFDS